MGESGLEERALTADAFAHAAASRGNLSRRPLQPIQPLQPVQPPQPTQSLQSLPARPRAGAGAEARSAAARGLAQPVAAAPAARSWRSGLRRLSRGLFSLAPSKQEAAHAEAVARIRTVFAGPRLIVFANPGPGATTTATLMAARTFGAYRGGGVVTWDCAETAAGLPGLPGLLDDPPRPPVLALVDSGGDARAEGWRAALAAADLVVVTATVRQDSAESALWMLDALERQLYGPGRLKPKAITLLSRPAPGYDQRLRATMESIFGGRTRAVLPIPYDPALAEGGRIDRRDLALDRVSARSRTAWLHACAAMAAAL